MTSINLGTPTSGRKGLFSEWWAVFILLFSMNFLVMGTRNFHIDATYSGSIVGILWLLLAIAGFTVIAIDVGLTVRSWDARRRLNEELIKGWAQNHPMPWSTKSTQGVKEVNVLDANDQLAIVCPNKESADYVVKYVDRAVNGKRKLNLYQRFLDYFGLDEAATD